MFNADTRTWYQKWQHGHILAFRISRFMVLFIELCQVVIANQIFDPTYEIIVSEGNVGINSGGAAF